MVGHNRPEEPADPAAEFGGEFGGDFSIEQERRRSRMVKRTIAGRGIRDERVLDAMRSVPREAFVPAELSASAHDDRALPIGGSQTISQPYIVALMAEAAEAQPDSRVLEIGTGSGYGAAVLARLAGEVHTVERDPALAEAAERRLDELGIHNVTVHCADGTLGWPAEAPYEAIVVTAAPDRLPEDLVPQLAEGGHLVIPIGPQGGAQRLWRYTRAGDGLRSEDLGGVAFVPLVSASDRRIIR